MRSRYGQPIDKESLGIKPLSPETKARMWTNRERKRVERDLPLFAELIQIPERTAQEVIDRDAMYRDRLEQTMRQSEDATRFRTAVTLRALRRSRVPRAVISTWYRWWRSSGPCLNHYSAAYCGDFWHHRFQEACGNAAYRSLLEVEGLSWVPWDPDEPLRPISKTVQQKEEAMSGEKCPKCGSASVRRAHGRGPRIIYTCRECHDRWSMAALVNKLTALRDRVAELNGDVAKSYRAGLRAAAWEVGTHWNDSQNMTNQKAQAERSAAILNRMADDHKKATAASTVAIVNDEADFGSDLL